VTLQLRCTYEARNGHDLPYDDDWMPLEVDTPELVERIERSIHRHHVGPMFLCSDAECSDWIVWLRDQGVIF
jgi:hypothetical protein